MADGVFKDGLLAGKVAFISGGSSGINLGIAQAFVKAGAKVAINGRNVEKLEGAVQGLQAHGTAMGVAADVRDYASVENALKTVRDAYGEIDILVCGAAGNFPAPVVGMSSNGFKAVMDIDVLGTFNVTRAAFEHLRKPGAAVINISAPQAYLPMALQAHVRGDAQQPQIALSRGDLGSQRIPGCRDAVPFEQRELNSVDSHERPSHWERCQTPRV